MQTAKELEIKAKVEDFNPIRNAVAKKAFTVGVKALAANQCKTINIFLNSTSNVMDIFEESVIYDQNLSGFNGSGAIGNLVYTQTLEASAKGLQQPAKLQFPNDSSRKGRVRMAEFNSIILLRES